MGKVVITLTIMPSAPDVDLAQIEEFAKKEISEFTGESEFKIEQKPVAFGLKSVNITFVADESKGGTEDIEKKIAALETVNSAEVTDVRRAF